MPPWLYDPVKVWTFFAVLFVAVVVAGVLVFLALRYLIARATIWALLSPHRLRAWELTWVVPTVVRIAWKAYLNGNTDLALRASARMLEWTLEPTRKTFCPWSVVNLAANVMINAGLYRQALAIPKRWSLDARVAGRRGSPREYLLVQINLAEALYNLGRLGCAAKVLEHISIEGERVRDPLLKAGAMIQLAWIAVLRDRPAEALELMDGVVPKDLPKEFRSEVWYTRAAALRDLGRTDEARQAVEYGLSRSRRASSKRNGIFLLGTIAFRANDWLAAIEHFERGAAHRYQGQGGDALLLLGEAYRRLERPTDMKRAYQMVAERDPQSISARRAKARLSVA